MKELTVILLKVFSLGLGGYFFIGIFIIPFGSTEIPFISDIYRPFLGEFFLSRIGITFLMLGLGSYIVGHIFFFSDRLEKRILSNMKYK